MNLPAGASMRCGTTLEWQLDGTFNFYRPAGSTQGVIEQTTSLALPPGAPIEATFTLANTDTVRKRVSVLVRSSA